MKSLANIAALIVAGLLLMFLGGCNNNAFNFISKRSAWETYSDKLTSSGIAETATGRLWYEAAEKALGNPPGLGVPSTVKGVFRPREVRALAWQFDAAKGTSIQIQVDWQPVGSSRVFLDIFEMLPEEKRLKSFASPDSLTTLEFKRTGTYIIRLQPELFAEGTFELIIKRTPTYAVFPVYGKDSRAVQSFWGAVRGGGTRSHEGIDIFASRGTPVVAPVAGAVTAVRDRGLGGKQVWMRDSERGFSLYFAHLDSQAVSFGTLVKPGDTLGFVGNTGNAKFTPPHLHFGIYAGGAMDPFPFVENRFKEPAPVQLNVETPFLVVNSSKGNFRKGPATSYAVLDDFDSQTPLFLLSATDDWYHVESPEGVRGFIHSSLLGAPTTASFEADSAYVFPNPFSRPTDSLLMPTEGFVSVGTYRDRLLLTDTLQNVYYVNN